MAKRPRKTKPVASTNGDSANGKPEKPAVGQLIPQAHGGALRHGGTNKGGSGRPPSAIRAVAREKFDKLIPTLSRIASTKNTKDRDRIHAIDILGKYGMDQAVSLADVRACLKEQNEIIREFLAPEPAEELTSRIKPVWLKL